jgi:hypothetical protein
LRDSNAIRMIAWGKIFVPKEPPWGSGVMRILCAGTRSPRATDAT